MTKRDKINNNKDIPMDTPGLIVFFVTWPILSIYALDFNDPKWSLLGGLLGSFIIGLIISSLYNHYKVDRKNKASLSKLVELASSKGLESYKELTDTDIFDQFSKQSSWELYKLLKGDAETSRFEYDHALYEVTKFLFGCYKDDRTDLLEATRNHLPVLAEKHGRLLYNDEFGDIHHDKWLSYYEDYASNKLTPIANNVLRFEELPHRLEKKFNIHEGKLNFTQIAINYRDQVVKDVSEKILSYVINEPVSATTAEHRDIDKMSGEEYEHYCGSQLKANGWEVIYTPAKGDRGVDIFATKENLSVAVQCKRSSYPVGNKAVQEIFSGAKLGSANHAIVVTNKTFTKQARLDALELNVTLIENNEINLIENIMVQDGLTRTLTSKY